MRGWKCCEMDDRELNAVHELLQESRDPARFACAMLHLAVDSLTQIGGRGPTATILLGQLRRLHGLGEPHLPAGNA